MSKKPSGPVNFKGCKCCGDEPRRTLLERVLDVDMREQLEAAGIGRARVQKSGWRGIFDAADFAIFGGD